VLAKLTEKNDSYSESIEQDQVRNVERRKGGILTHGSYKIADDDSNDKSYYRYSKPQSR